MSNPGQSSPQGKRSGSQKRKVTDQIKINCTRAQKEKVLKLTEACGQSAATLALNALLGTPLPARVRRPRVDEGALARLLAELQKWRGELNMLGSNMNQIAFHLNAGRPGDTIEARLESTLRELIHALEGDLTEMRTGVMQVLGLERDQKGDD